MTSFAMTTCLLANVLALIGAVMLCLALVTLAAALVIVAANKIDGAVDDILYRWREQIASERNNTP